MVISKLSTILNDNHSAIIISSPENRRYFTGFPSSDGFLVVTPLEAIFFTDSRYIEAAKNAEKHFKARLLTRASKEILGYLQENNITSVFLERERLTVDEFDNFKRIFKPVRVVASKSVEKKINALRRTKAKEEVENI